eukprot:9485737-Pyramimonas_sp.AAC.1
MHTHARHRHERHAYYCHHRDVVVFVNPAGAPWLLPDSSARPRSTSLGLCPIPRASCVGALWVMPIGDCGAAMCCCVQRHRSHSQLSAAVAGSVRLQP